MKENLKCQKGLTLIEVLISIVLLAIILTSLIGFFTQSAIFNKKNKEKMDTIQTAQLIKNQININITKSILQNDNKIDSSGKTTILDYKYLNSYCNLNSFNFSSNPNYKYWAEITKITKPNPYSSIDLIQCKIIVQDQNDNNKQSITYTYIRG